MRDSEFIEVMEVKPKHKGSYIVILWDYGKDGGVQKPPQTYYHDQTAFYNGMNWEYEKENVLVCFIKEVVG